MLTYYFHSVTRSGNRQPEPIFAGNAKPLAYAAPHIFDAPDPSPVHLQTEQIFYDGNIKGINYIRVSAHFGQSTAAWPIQPFLSFSTCVNHRVWYDNI